MNEVINIKIQEAVEDLDRIKKRKVVNFLMVHHFYLLVNLCFM